MNYKVDFVNQYARKRFVIVSADSPEAAADSVISDFGGNVDISSAIPHYDSDYDDDTDDRGWLEYGERMTMQSRAEM